jgi:prephenate dehydratase
LVVLAPLEATTYVTAFFQRRNAVLERKKADDLGDEAKVEAIEARLTALEQAETAARTAYDKAAAAPTTSSTTATTTVEENKSDPYAALHATTAPNAAAADDDFI